VAETIYNTAPDWRTTWVDDQGVPLIDGTLEFFKASDHGTQKAVYQSNIITPPATTPPAYPNPIDLASGANVAAIFFASDENYYIELRDSSGTLVQSVDNWNSPENTDPTPKATEVDFTNYLGNSDFSQSYRTKFESSQLPDHFQTPVASLWNFDRSNTNATITLEFIDFIPGQTDVPNQPDKYLTYECTAIGGGGETFKEVFQQIPDVRTLNAEEIFISFYAKSSSNSQVIISIDQIFGTGGSSSIITNLDTVQLTSSWVKYTVTGTVPSISGKTIGEDSLIEFLVTFPLNEIANIDLTHFQLVRGKEELEYNYLPRRFSNAKAVGLQIPEIIPTYDALNHSFLSHNEKGVVSWLDWSDLLPAGLLFPYPVDSPIPIGFLICHGSLVFTFEYPRLSSILLDKYGREYTFASALSNVTTVTNFRDGAVTDVTAGTSPFSVNVTQQGTGVLPEKFTVTTVAASAITGGTYFEFSSLPLSGPETNFYVWMQVAGAGSNPALGGKTQIKLTLDGSEDADLVADKLKDVLHILKFQLPDYRGRFLRGRDAGEGRDPDAAGRTNRGDGTTGDNAGTLQTDGFKSHTHTVNTTTTGNYDKTTGASVTVDEKVPPDATENVTDDPLTITPTALSLTSISSAVTTGGNETRPLNIYVNYIIKY
jgi:microcystin-dependent protein